MRGVRLHVGMDMHKRFSVVTVIDESGEELGLVATLAIEQLEDWVRRYLDMSLLAEWSAPGGGFLYMARPYLI